VRTGRSTPERLSVARTSCLGFNGILNPDELTGFFDCFGDLSTH